MKDTREYIIDEAYKLFLNNSYEAVSISDISKAIGLTKGALYHHFTNKEELFKAVIDKNLWFADINTNLDNMSFSELIETIVSKAREIIQIKININDKQPIVPINFIALAIDAYRHYPDFVKANKNLIEKELMKFRDVIKNGIKRGELRTDINVEMVALNLYAISAGTAGSLLHNASLESAIESLKEQLQEYYKLIKKRG